MVSKGAVAAAIVVLAVGGAGAAYALTRPKYAPPGGTQGAVTVTVTDSTTGLPVSGATVILAGTLAGPSGTTDSTGTWASPSIPPGNYLVTVSKSGYVTFQQEMALSPPQTVPVSLAVQPPPPPLFVTFVSFTAGPSTCVSVWNNPNTAAVNGVCYVVVNDSTGATVSIGLLALSMAAGAPTTFNVPLGSASGFATLPPGTYTFHTFVVTPTGQPISTSHVETDTVA